MNRALPPAGGTVRWRVWALVVALLLGAGLPRWIGQPGAGTRRGPIAVPDPAATPPETVSVGSARLVVTRRPTHRLLLDTASPAGPARLLWLGGVTAQPRGSGSVVLDRSGHLLEFDPHLRARPVRAALGEREVLGAAGAPGGGLWLTAAGGEVIRLGPDGEVQRSFRTSFSYPAVASDGDGNAWLIRSAARFAFRWDSGGSPLLIRLDAATAGQDSVGRAIVPDHVLLQDLANAGAVAIAGDTLYYAPFIRDEVIALNGRGDTLWLAARGLPQSSRDPRFEVQGGRVVIDYHPVNLGAVIGPDGRLYVLSTPGFTTQTARLDVFDREHGTLLRTAAVPTALPSLAADSTGRVYLLDERALLTGTRLEHREPLAPFQLEVRGGGHLALQELRGKVVLVNFWATWCAPCRKELPALDRLRREIRDPDFAFLTVNEDLDTAAVPEFLSRLGLDLPVLLGRGAMREKYHYPGLPYTLILDRDGNVVRRWAGYLDEERLAALRTTLEAELRLGSGAAAAHAGHRRR